MGAGSTIPLFQRHKDPVVDVFPFWDLVEIWFPYAQFFEAELLGKIALLFLIRYTDSVLLMML